MGVDPPEPGGYSVHERAASADPEAFATLCGWHRDRAKAGVEPPQIALARASDYARLAAIARGDRADWLTFLIVLDNYAAALREVGLDALADHSEAEAVTLAEFMADEGDEEVAAAVASSADTISPEAFTIARNLREHLKGKFGC